MRPSLPNSDGIRTSFSSAAECGQAFEHGEPEPTRPPIPVPPLPRPPEDVLGRPTRLRFAVHEPGRAGAFELDASVPGAGLAVASMSSGTTAMETRGMPRSRNRRTRCGPLASTTLAVRISCR